VAVRERIENMEKPGIAVELRDCAVGKGCFAMEVGLAPVERNGVAVGKSGSAVEENRSAVGRGGERWGEVGSR
jgi:hypothetical protein